MNSLATSGARGALAAFASQGTSLIARLATIIILARLLIPEYFGLVAIVAAFAEFAANIIQFGLPLAAAQATSLSARAKSTLFLVNSCLGFVFAGAFLTGAVFVAELYGDERLADLIRWLALIPFAVGFSAQFRAQLMSDLRFVSIELVMTVTRLIGMVSSVAVAALTGSIYALVVLVVLPQVIQLPWLMAIAHWWPGRPGAWKEAGGILIIGSHIFGINLMRNISRTAIIPILGIYESPENVGFYDRAYQLSAVPANTLMDSLQRIAVPLLARARSDSRKLQRSFEKMQTTATLALVTATWVVAAIGEPAVILALGEEWILAGTILQFLSIGTGFRLMAMMEQWLFIGGKATRAGLIFSAWSQPLVIVVSLGGLPWGPVGVAAANALAWALLWPLSIIAAAKATGLKGKALLTKSLAITVGFSAPVALSAAASRFFIHDPAAIVITGLSSALVLGGLLIWLRPSIRETVVAVVLAAVGRQRNRS